MRKDFINNNNKYVKKTKILKYGKYEGETKNDLMKGKGILYYNNSKRYEGEFKNGKREGKGILYYNDGGKYIGEFKNGKREGKLIDYFNNGNR